MTDEAEVVHPEDSRHDPLLRLDQMIYRQDQTVRRLRSLLKASRILIVEVGLLIAITLLHLILALWK